MKRAIGRLTTGLNRVSEHDETDNALADARETLDELTVKKKAVAEQVKALSAKKKELGRSPRHSRVRAALDDLTNIPRLSLLSTQTSLSTALEPESRDSDVDLHGTTNLL